MRIVLVVTALLVLSGCIMSRYFGPDFSDPQAAVVIIQTKGPLFDGANLASMDGGEDDHLRNVGYLQDSVCMVQTGAVLPGKYKLKNLIGFYGSSAGGQYTYSFDVNDPSTPGFEARPGDVIFLGSYEVSDDEETGSFSFNKTDVCGTEKDALLSYQGKYANRDRGILSDTMWPEKVEQALSALK